MLSLSSNSKEIVVENVPATDFVMPDAFDNAWLWHDPDFLLPLVSRGGARKSGVLTACKNGGTVGFVPYAICPTGPDGEFELSLGGWSLPYPATRTGLGKNEKKVIAALISAVDCVAHEERALRLAMAVLPQQDVAFSNALERNPLLSFPGFLACHQYTSMIDLTSGSDKVLEQVRKRYRRYIRSNAEELVLTDYTGESVPEQSEDIFFSLGKADSSQSPTKGEAEWKMHLVRSGKAFLFEARTAVDRTPAGMLVVLKSGRHAFDFTVSVDDRFKDLRVSHALKAFAIKILADSGVLFYELGIYSGLPGLYRIPDAKNKGITEFKTGFANKVSPLFLAEKFYDAGYMEKLFSLRVNALQSELFYSEEANSE